MAPLRGSAAHRAQTPDAGPYILAARDSNFNNNNNNNYSSSFSSRPSNYNTSNQIPPTTLGRASSGDSSENPIWRPYSFADDERDYRAQQRRQNGGSRIGHSSEDGPDDGLENGHYEKPHESVGFFHHKMSKVRRHVLLLWARTIIILMIAVVALLSLYWAALYKEETRTRNLVVYVVDFDGQVAPYTSETNPFVGETMVLAAETMYNSPETRSLGFTVLPASQFDYNPTAVRQAVYDWNCWAAVIIYPNATALLREAVSTGNASYSPSGSVQYVYQSARQETTAYNYIVPTLQSLTMQFTTQFGKQWTQNIMSDNSISRQNMERASSAVNPGITPLQIDLRPLQPSTVTAATTIGLIYLIIISFFSFSFFLPIHMKYVQPQGHPPLHFWHLIIWRWVVTVVAYFFISLAYSLVSLAMQIPFWMPPASSTEVAFNPTAYGLGSFPVFWVVNFLGMCALGLASENVAMFIGQPWAGLWLMFWVISNVTTSFYPMELIPGFFSWGYAWPLHQVVDASRHILFDLKSDIGKNIGILIAWVVVDSILFPFCCYFMRWKTEKGQRDQEKNKDKYVVKTQDGEKDLSKPKGEKPPIRKRGFMRGM